MTASRSDNGVLLVNLGSPQSPEPDDVREYLAEFLDDPRVVDLPTPVRRGLLKFIILPSRPAKSGEAYEQIWTDEGSPLIIESEKAQALLQERLEMPVSLGMRYGKPSIEDGIRELLARDVQRMLLVPLYPHYAMSSYETVVAKCREVLEDIAPRMELEVQAPFFKDEDYIEALYESARPYLEGEQWDHLLLSYHGIPERHVRKTDPSGNYCMAMEGCCDKPNPAHAFCYRHQIYATSKAFTKRAGLDQDQYSVTFQSRLGIRPWLQPYTDKEIVRFPTRGIKRLLVMCPAFVSDCLETLEEIAIRAEEDFLEAGGEELIYVPCMNDHPKWIDVLERFARDFEGSENKDDDETHDEAEAALA